MNNKERYSYYAFISYSHKDAKWAEWIQRAIEHYKLPAIIRKEAQKPLPKRIAPVFRDATDLGVDVLVDGLHAELENSRYLIVVCSPNSAKPNAEGKSFVDEEVRHFCELGRVKQVIPVIIEGTPEEAFGPVLKSQEILAIDATKQPKARVLNDIVAKILGLKPDALWRRAERERRKRLVLRSALCGLVGLCAAFAGWFAWDSNRLVKNYFANYVDSFGLPEGIFPLKESDLAHRHDMRNIPIVRKYRTSSTTGIVASARFATGATTAKGMSRTWRGGSSCGTRATLRMVLLSSSPARASSDSRMARHPRRLSALHGVCCLERARSRSILSSATRRGASRSGCS